MLFLICGLIAFLSIFLGPYVLEQYGILYVSEGGGYLGKIHPVSYFIFYALLIDLLQRKESKMPYSYNETIYLPLFWAFISVIWVSLYGLFLSGPSGLAYLLVTFLFPIIFFYVILKNFYFAQLVALRNLVIILLCTNALFCIFEYFYNYRILSVDFPEFGASFRSSGFLGHPLLNALVMATAIPFSFKFNRYFAFAIIAILLFGIFSTGARAASVAVIISFVIFSIIVLFKNNTEKIRSIDAGDVAIYLVSFSLFLSAIFYVLNFTDIAARSLGQLELDDGGRARFDALYVLEELRIAEWVFGADKALQDSLVGLIGIPVIENYFIYWLVQFGLVGALPLAVCFVYLLWKVFLTVDYVGKWSLLLFFIVSLTNNSLATKTNALIILFCLMAADVKKNSTLKDNNG